MLKSGVFDPFYAEQRSMMREKRARERDPWKAANFEEHWGEQLLKRLWDGRNDGAASGGAQEAPAAVELPVPAASLPTPTAAAPEEPEKERERERERDRERDRKRTHRKKESRPRPAAAIENDGHGNGDKAVTGVSAGVSDLVEEKEKWLACDQCDQWVIAAQDGITDLTPYDETLNPNPIRYLCPICRGEERERAAKRAGASLSFGCASVVMTVIQPGIAIF